MTAITDYINNAPENQQDYLNKTYQTIKPELPDAEEQMKYGMPTFNQDGENLVHFAGMKKHLGFYPTPEVLEQFADKLQDYHTSKGAVQFPYDKPLPTDLIKEMTDYRRDNRK